MNVNEPETIQKYLREWAIVRSYRYQKWPQLIGETKTEAIAVIYIQYFMLSEEQAQRMKTLLDSI